MEEILNDTIEKNKLNEEKHQEEIQKIRREREEERQILEQKKLEEKEFYSSTYQFHIKSNTPFYTFETGINYCSLLYIAEDKSLNFLAIDGNSKQEANGIIPYDHIHYYEKAGTIHYVTEVNASYQEGGSFGGSFKPGQFNIGKSILGGLLFGPMGMAVGTMASYKPSEYTPPQYNPGSFNINSTCTRIDERSVILNYYSDEHKQYMDIELPHDIFNFLQTHYSEKKYDIVIELEKQSAAKTLTPTISPVSDNNNKVLSIKERLANLKDLYENELISLNDYESRKKEILSEM